MTQYLECGKIVGTHGIRGAVLIDPWCDSPEVLTRIKTLYLKSAGGMTPLRVERAGVYKRMVRIFFEGVTNPDLALPLKGRVLYAGRADIPIAEGAHFIADLVGLSVLDIDTGQVYGTLADVITPGTGADLYVVKTPDGREVLMPAVDEFVRRIDMSTGIYIKPIEGMFDA